MGSRIGKAIAAQLGGSPIGTTSDDGYWHCFDCGAEGKAAPSHQDAGLALRAHRDRDHSRTESS